MDKTAQYLGANCVNNAHLVKVRIGWQDYILPAYRLGDFTSLMLELRSLGNGGETSFVNFQIDEAPDLVYEKLKVSAREEVKDTLVKEKEQMSQWWQTANKERDIAKKEVQLMSDENDRLRAKIESLKRDRLEEDFEQPRAGDFL